MRTPPAIRRVARRAGNVGLPRRAAYAIGLAAVGVAATAAIQAASGALRLQRALTDAQSRRPFQLQPVRVAARLLIVGDSTAVGLGASSLALGLAGLIARDHPSVVIVNRATVDADLDAVQAQLQQAEPFDTVLVLAGGGDVLRLRQLGGLQRTMQRIAAAARRIAPNVVLMPTPLPASLPARLGGSLGQPWSWLAARRNRAVQRAAAKAAQRHGALVVDLMGLAAVERLSPSPRQLVADDGLHPNDLCYALWYDQLKTQTWFSALLTRAHRKSQQQGDGSAPQPGAAKPGAVADTRSEPSGRS